MTLNEMTQHIADAMNLSSPEALARIARNINVRYKRVTSAVGLVTTRREEASMLVTIGNRDVTFTGIEKVDVVFRKVGTKAYPLTEITDDEMLVEPLRDEPPTKFSVFSIAPRAVTVRLNCVPTTAFTLYTHGLADVSTLSNNDSPAFSESFHDILIQGVLADEYRKKEKPNEARECEHYYEQRLSDLKMHIAKSAYLELYAGKHRLSDGWWDASGSK